MSSRSSVFVVLIDGMRGDYLNKDDTPFIYGQIEKGLYIKALKKEAPFCERSEIYTGENSSVTGNYAAFTYDPEKSPYFELKKYDRYLRVADFFSFTLPTFFKGKSGYYLYRLCKKLRASCTNRIFDCSNDASLYSVNDIPNRALSQFRLTEDQYLYNYASAFKVPTIFNKLEVNGKKYAYFFDDLRVKKPRLSRDQRFKLVKDAFREDFDLYLYADSEIDAITHLGGTSKEVRKDVVSRVDSMISELHRDFIMNHKNGVTILFSPHGMLDVEKYFSPEQHLLSFFKKNKFDVPQDVAYFIDSTMVRVWGNDVHKIKALFKSKEWAKYGVYVNDDIGKKYNIKKNDYIQEEVWWAFPGVCNFPDFFRRYTPPKGMHGYFMDTVEMDGFASITGLAVQPSIMDKANLKNIYHTICHILNIANNEENYKSWLSQT